MATDDNNLVKEGGSDTAKGAVAQMPKKSYKSKKRELASKAIHTKMGEKGASAGMRRMDDEVRRRQKAMGEHKDALSAFKASHK